MPTADSALLDAGAPVSVLGSINATPDSMLSSNLYYDLSKEARLHKIDIAIRILATVAILGLYALEIFACRTSSANLALSVVPGGAIPVGLTWIVWKHENSLRYKNIFNVGIAARERALDNMELTKAEKAKIKSAFTIEALDSLAVEVLARKSEPYGDSLELSQMLEDIKILENTILKLDVRRTLVNMKSELKQFSVFNAVAQEMKTKLKIIQHEVCGGGDWPDYLLKKEIATRFALVECELETIAKGRGKNLTMPDCSEILKKITLLQWRVDRGCHEEHHELKELKTQLLEETKKAVIDAGLPIDSLPSHLQHFFELTFTS